MTDTAEHAPPRLRREPAERAARALLPVCAGVWTAAEIMHATGCPWVDIGLSSAVLAALAGLKGARNAAKGILLAGAWTAAAVRLGPLAGPALYCPLTWGWAVLSFCGWRWARSHPSVVSARDKRNQQADWLDKRNRWGLHRTHLLDYEPTRLGHWFLADVRGTGKRASAIVHSDVAERIAEDLMLPVSRVRVKTHRLAGRIEVSIRETDPWAKPIPHPAVTQDHELDLSGPFSITRPAVVGQDPETGKPLQLLLCGPGGGRNVNVVATIDSGKTVLASCISERVTKAPDALLCRINLSIKGDGERSLWGPACHLTAFGPRETGRARKVLAVLAGIIEWRSQQPKTTANWVPSPEDPHLVLIADEIDALAEDPACKRYLEQLGSKGREFGYTSVRLGQRGTAQWTGGSNVRAVDGVICLGRVNRAMEAMHAAGDLGMQLPDMARYGEGRPGVWAVADLADSGYLAGRSFNLSEPGDIRRIVAERADYQPDLQPELKAFLGKTYEELLSTDVYAKWARGRHGQSPAVAHPRPDAPPEAAPDGTEPVAAPLAVLADNSLAALDEELNAAVPDELRARWLKQGEKLAETRRVLNETTGMDTPDIPHDDLVAHADAQWRQIGEKTVIPDDHRTRLLALLTVKISAGNVAQALGVTPWIARTYLERLRLDGLARAVGKGRGAGWIGVRPPQDGDGA